MWMSGLSYWILDELWWTMMNSGVQIALFLSVSVAERREDCGEKNADQAPEIPNSGCHHIESHRHIDISTYRHIDMACLKDFFPLPRTIIYDAISFQKCSNSGTFTFDVMKCFQICPFQEPSYLMRFLFSNFPFQELSHLMWFVFPIFSFSGTIIFDVILVQKLSFSGTFTFHVKSFQICSVSARIAFDMIFFSFQVTLETGAAFLFGLLRGRLRCTICLLTV